MSRTITDANVLVLIIGDDHCIVAYYVVRAEMWADFSPAWNGCASDLVASGPFTCCRSGGATGKASMLPLGFKCPQSPAQV